MLDNTIPSYGSYKVNQQNNNYYNQQNNNNYYNQQNNKPIDINNSNEVEDTNRLVIGLNDKKKELYIPESSRYLNTLVLGLKGTGKTSDVLPMFLEQDFKNKKVGATVIVTKKEMAYTTYALAKKYKRKIILLKPSINNEISNKLLWQTSYDYDYINEFIINYKDAIKKKHIVIIDMEILKYKSEGLRAVAMLLLQLQLDIQETDITQRTSHFLYVDDAQYYIPFMEHLLSFSDNYNLGITLFMQSRNQFIKNGKDYTSIIDNNVRTILLLNSLNLEDVKFYSERFYEHKNLNNFYNRKLNSYIYETLDFNNKRKVGIADFKLITKEERIELETKAKKTRTKLLKEKRVQREKELLRMIQERSLSENNLYDLSDTDKENNKLLLNDYDNIDEPKPFDLNILDEDNIIKDNINKGSTELNYVGKIVSKKIKENEIKEIIFVEEKENKRKVSSNIFNKLNSNIDYCDDIFDFNFE